MEIGDATLFYMPLFPSDLKIQDMRGYFLIEPCNWTNDQSSLFVFLLESICSFYPY